MNAVWENAPLSGNELLLLLALADFANDEGECWPSQATLALKTRMSERSVIRMVKKLAEQGAIFIQQERRGRSTRNSYTIIFGALRENGLRQSVTVNEEVQGDKSDVQGDTAMSPESPIEPPGPKPTSTASKRNIIWDILVEQFGEPAPSERSDFGKTVKEIKANLAGLLELSADDEGDWPSIRHEIQGRIEEMGDFRSHRSLRTRWTELGKRMPRAVETTADLPVASMSDTQFEEAYGLKPVGSCPVCKPPFDPDCRTCAGTGRDGYVL